MDVPDSPRSLLYDLPRATQLLLQKSSAYAHCSLYSLLLLIRTHLLSKLQLRPRIHDQETRRKRNIVFLDEFLVRLVENLDKLSLRTHCQDQISSFSNCDVQHVRQRGKFDSTGTTLGAAFANLMLLRVKADVPRKKNIKSQQLQILQLLTFNIRTLTCSGVQNQRTSDRSSPCCSPLHPR